jgi:glycosyltransferase involved in cell wall biosynthesis
VVTRPARAMRITIDLTPTVQGHAGLGRYAGELAQALQASEQPGEQLTAFYDDPLHRTPEPPLDTLPARMLSSNNKVWRARVMAAYAGRQSQDRLLGFPDVFLATDHLLPRLRHAYSVFLLADVTFLSHPKMHSTMNRSYLRLMMPHFLKAAGTVITISQCSLKQAVAHYPFIETKVRIVYPGVRSDFAPVTDSAKLNEIRKRLALPERFLLYVGTIEPRKNLGTLFEAYRSAELHGVDLVIAGSRGWLSDEIYDSVKDLQAEGRVMFTGFVADDDLPALYSSAEAFVFPSIYEGFGLPVLEAMACGTPVICSDASSLPEVAGDAATLLPPRDVAAWGQAMAQVAGSSALRSELRERGLRQALRFSWTSAAEQTRAIWRDSPAIRQRPR